MGTWSVSTGSVVWRGDGSWRQIPSGAIPPGWRSLAPARSWPRCPGYLPVSVDTCSPKRRAGGPAPETSGARSFGGSLRSPPGARSLGAHASSWRTTCGVKEPMKRRCTATRSSRWTRKRHIRCETVPVGGVRAPMSFWGSRRRRAVHGSRLRSMPVMRACACVHGIAWAARTLHRVSRKGRARSLRAANVSACVRGPNVRRRANVCAPHSRR